MIYHYLHIEKRPSFREVVFLYRTAEECVAKLYYLFSKDYPKAKIKELMKTDLCGKISRSI